MEDALFPFGFGLSYTQFEFGPAVFSKRTLKSHESIQLTVPVRNTGKYDGTEVLQVYVRKVDEKDGPFKTLRDFKRVNIKSGKTRRVTVDLPPSSFEFYNPVLRKMDIMSGEYEVLYGNSSDRRDLDSAKIKVQ